MKHLLFFALILPVVAFSQVKKKAVKAPPKNVVVKTVTPPKATDGFEISGTISGVNDGEIIKMLNGSTGAEEGTTKIQGGAFLFKGQIATPEFKLLAVNGQPPFISIFADNSKINVKAETGAFENAVVTGSPSHDDFALFIRYTKPYEEMLSGRGKYPIAFMDKGAMSIENFVNEHPKSYVTPLAIFRYNQLTGDYDKLEAMYSNLSPVLKETPIGKYLLQEVEANRNASYNKPLADFNQPDSSGKNISLSSFKGKYVLVDFWASWCGPCRAENPNVVSTFEKYKNKNFTVLGVSFDQDKTKWLTAVTADNLAWTHVSDLRGWANAVGQQFGIQSIPQNFLIDPNGNLVGKNLRGAALEYRLSKLIH